MVRLLPVPTRPLALAAAALAFALVPAGPAAARARFEAGPAAPPPAPAPPLAALLAREPLRMGTAWYPEQWPEARWNADLDLMRAAHLTVVRIGEFAWSTMEPRDGVFDFGWLDRAIDDASRHGIAVVLGTPTAAPPAWLTTAHPEVLRIDESGARDEHGERQQFSYADPLYRRYAREIAARMAERYGHDPRVVGWQIDNELAETSFDPAAKSQWHAWLAARYGTIAALNRRWTTAYWSQTYDGFDQVPMHAEGENPGLALDDMRFVTDTWRRYVANQLDAIRLHSDGRQFVTTNTMGWFDGFDHYALHRDLDLAAWDDYVPDGRYRWLDNAVRHDLVRGFKRADFWVMETQPAFVNWGTVNRALDPGQTREITWQAVGHGADAVLYWQWRSALNGQEQYHGTLVGADGTPVPIYAEIARTAAEFGRAAPALAGTTPHARVAMLQDYDSRWAIGFQKQDRRFDPVAEFDDLYRPLERGAQAIDIVSPETPLAGYALVVAPALNVLTDAEAARLASYVRGGGHLVLGPRSGMKDGFDALHVERQPGPLAALLGGRVEQFYDLDRPVPVDGAPGAGTASVWAEVLGGLRPGVAVDLRYGRTGTWTDGAPAMITRAVGRGRITYLGAWLDPDLMERAAAAWLASAGVKPILAGTPPGLEVCERDGATHRVLVLINHAGAPGRVVLPAPLHDALRGGDVSGTLTLGPHDVAVLSGGV